MKVGAFHYLSSLVLVLTAAVGVQVATQVAASAATCNGGSCTGLDPTATGCSNGASNVDQFLGHYNSNIGKDVYVELRGNGTCKARWLRVTPTNSEIGCGGGAPTHVRLRDIGANGAVISERIKTFDPCGGQFVTAMVGRTSGSVRTQFCFTETFDRSAESAWGTDQYYHPCNTQPWG